MKRVIALVAFLFIVLLGLLISSGTNVKSKQNNDKTFLIQHESAIKEKIQKHFDKRKTHIKSVQVDYKEIDSGYDVNFFGAGDYYINFSAHVNNDKTKVVYVHISFPKAEKGAFSLFDPNPYRHKENMRLILDDFSYSTEDTSIKDQSNSWWNFNHGVWYSNIDLTKNDPSSQTHKTLVEIYGYHRQSVLDFASKQFGVPADQLIEVNIEHFNFNDIFDRGHEMRIHFNNKLTFERLGSVYLYVPDDILKNPEQPILGYDENDVKVEFQVDANVDPNQLLSQIQQEYDELYKQARSRAIQSSKDLQSSQTSQISQAN